MNPQDFPVIDSIEKRRKQIEKAKAAHLSRQLQTRLQYARLKVDHGWQKQTLNEVENLYFHHYRARIPPRSTVSLQQHITKTEKNASTSVQPTITSSPVKELSPSTVVSPSVKESTIQEDEDSQMDVDPPARSLTATTTTTVASDLATSNNSQIPGPSSPTPSHPYNRTSLLATPPTPQLIPPSLTSPVSAAAHPSRTPPLPTPSRSSSHTTSTSQSQIRPNAQSVPTPHPPVSRPSATQFPRSSVPPSPNMRSSRSSPSSVALTYDSFWSSHSTVNSYRSAMPGNTIPGPTYATFTAGTPTYAALPIQKRPTVARATAGAVPRQISSGGAAG